MMIAKELISDLIPVLHTSDSGRKALHFMETFRVSHLPIVNNKEFLGLISDSDIYNLSTTEEPIGNYSLSLFSPFVFEDQHIYEVIALASKLKLTIIPVLNRENEYLGSVLLSDLAGWFSMLTGVGQPGGIITLVVHINDYSLSEIARIVESNNARILSVYIFNHEGSFVTDVTIKVNTTEITSILQTFERYNYRVRATFMEDDELSKMLVTRYEEFMKYLNI
jgi:acetoin utilization protein AcuB